MEDIQTKFDHFWSLIEKTEEVEKRRRRCPKCDEEDCKYGIHDKDYVGIDLSICCNDCNHCETAMADDCTEIIENWHDPID